jgi:hypothetical protein
MKPAYRYWLLAAVVVGLLARIPGLFWGSNFPTGWAIHHPDEWPHLMNAQALINPLDPPEWSHPYPKGLAAHVAVPVFAARLLQGKLLVKSREEIAQAPERSRIVLLGRIVSALYGTGTILLVYLVGRRLFESPWVGVAGAGILALGGLHVSQSHFFVADASALFWWLLGTLLLLRYVQDEPRNDATLLWAGFSFGVAFGVKLSLASIPSLFLVAAWQRPRIMRILHTGIFFLAGFVVVNFAAYTPFDLYKTLVRGAGNPYQYSVWSNVGMYLLELPSVVSLPVFLLALVALYPLGRRLFLPANRSRLLPLLVVVGLPLLIQFVPTALKLSHFARHLVPFLPWLALAAGWSLVSLSTRLRARGLHPVFVCAPLFAYLALFVYDGEKGYLREPRNEAARWIQHHIAPGTQISWEGHNDFSGYRHTVFPDRGRPCLVVIEMYRANHYLSGMGWKNSYPRDIRYIFDAISQEHVDAFQALFKGETEYQEVARFGERYFMPEYTFTDRVLGNRSRNYLSEVVIFSNGSCPGLPAS